MNKGSVRETLCIKYVEIAGLMPKGTTRASPVTPAAEPRSSDLTIAMVNDARKGLSTYAKNDRITSKAAARKRLGAKGRAR